jgi:nucleoside 2-deoxyribosyltransferase
MHSTTTCTVCGSVDGEDAKLWNVPSRDMYRLECPACGCFEISRSAAEDSRRLGAEARRALSHMLRWKTELVPSNPPCITSNVLKEFAEAELPTVYQQIDNCLRYLALRCRHLGREYESVDPALISAIGAIDASATVALLEELRDAGQLKAYFISEENAVSIKLTLQGWTRAGELEHGLASEAFGFMAMQYGDTLLEQVVAEVFRPSAELAGFSLEILRDRPQAGVIDNYLRSRLKLCRFVIADLSHANNGAYWEAGYAEGLGKPVIYTCNAAVFEASRTHFDTNHCQTIVWDEANLAEAKTQLLACIRNTLPEAK